MTEQLYCVMLSVDAVDRIHRNRTWSDQRHAGLHGGKTENDDAAARAGLQQVQQPAATGVRRPAETERGQPHPGAPLPTEPAAVPGTAQ